MSCSKFGWRGHRYSNGICECGISKKKAMIQKLEKQAIVDYDDEGIGTKLLRFAPFIFIILFSVMFIPKMVSGFFSIGHSNESVNSDLDESNNTTLIPPTSILPPAWVFITLLPFVIIVIFKMMRYMEYP